ncbi:hypothetical protein Ocin01_06645, partial [Orchesella cincta]
MENENETKINGRWFNDSSNNNGIINTAFEGDNISLDDRTDVVYPPRNSVESQIISSALSNGGNEKSLPGLDELPIEDPESHSEAPERGQ